MCNRSGWFKKMCKAISASYVPYTGPAYNALRTSLLQEVKDRVDDACTVWYQHGLDVTGFVAVSDGWADAQSRPLLNMLLCSPKGHKFLKAVDTSGHEKSGQYIADQMTVVINEVGAHNVTGVIMDGAANNVNASKIIEERYCIVASCLHLICSFIVAVATHDSSVNLQIPSYFLSALHCTCRRSRLGEDWRAGLLQRLHSRSKKDCATPDQSSISQCSL